MKIFSSKAHAIIGILMGVFVIHIPGIFGFWGKNGAADAVAIAVGTIILLNELTADDEISPIKLLPRHLRFQKFPA